MSGCRAGDAASLRCARLAAMHGVQSPLMSPTIRACFLRLRYAFIHPRLCEPHEAALLAESGCKFYGTLQTCLIVSRK